MARKSRCASAEKYCVSTVIAAGTDVSYAAGKRQSNIAWGFSPAGLAGASGTAPSAIAEGADEAAATVARPTMAAPIKSRRVTSRSAGPVLIVSLLSAILCPGILPCCAQAASASGFIACGVEMLVLGRSKVNEG